MKRTHWVALFLVLGLLSIFAILGMRLASPATAGTSRTTVQSPILGPILDIRTGDGVDNYYPAVAYNSLHDEYLVVWYTQQVGTTWDMWARRVGADGTLQSCFCVATVGGEKRWQPAVAYSPTKTSI